jgi:copper transport protein
MWRKAACALLLALLALLASPAPASAHAILVGTTPESWQVLDSSPHEVTLRFNEPVDAGLAEIRLIGPHGDDVQGIGRPEHPGGAAESISVALPNALANGTHTVAYRVVSADSHPVQGAFTFSVGEASGGAAPVAFTTPGDWTVSIVYGVLRWVGFAALALLIGTAFFTAQCWPGGGTRAGVRRLLRGSWGTLLGVTICMLLVYNPYATGGSLADAIDPQRIGATLASRMGVMLLVRLALLTIAAAGLSLFLRHVREPQQRAAQAEAARQPAMAAASAGHGPANGALRQEGAPPERTLRRESARWAPGTAVLGFGAALSLTWSLANHAAAGGQIVLALIADVAHLMAMCVWLGGLAVLTAVLLRSGDALGMRLAVPRFSRLALICVGVLAITGIFQAWRQVGTLSALSGTTYGTLLLAKVGLVALLIGLGWFARKWARRHYGFPVVTVTDKRRARRGPPQDEIQRFRRSVAVEAGLAALVLGVTAVLVSVEPAAAQVARESATSQAPAYTGPVSVVLPFDAGGGEAGRGRLAATVLPGKVGPNEIHLSVVDVQMAPKDVPEVRADLRLPDKGLGPIPVALQYFGTGHYIASGATLPMPGQWELAVTIRTSETNQAVARIPVGAR